jgi:DedD protein
MDRSLLERMIGATVLVILLVVLAPALLDGRKPPGAVSDASRDAIMDAPAQIAPVRVETITLGGSSSSAPKVTATSPVKSTTVTKPAPQAVVKPKTKSSAPVAKSGDQWMVQLGSFSAKDNAEKYAAKVKASGFPAMVSSFRSGGKTMYRVQVGPRDDRASADRLVAQLKKSGHKGLVMPVNP